MAEQQESIQVAGLAMELNGFGAEIATDDVLANR